MGGQIGEDDSRGLRATIEKIKSKNKDELSEYDKELLRWYRNVDKRYAWVVLVVLWLAMGASLGPFRIYGLIFAKVTNEGIYTRAEASWPATMVGTCGNLASPLISIIVSRVSFRQSCFIGGLLATLGYGLTGLSNSVLMDTILIGFVHGIGGAFLLIASPGIINSYFIKYRTIAMGVCTSGCTVAIFILSPIFQWLLEHYPWRYSYFGLGLVSSVTLFVAPLLRPNPRPEASRSSSSGGEPVGIALAAVGQEADSHGGEQQGSNKERTNKRETAAAIMPLVWAILKTPAFYIICYQKCTYFLISSVYSMILVDNGRDHGHTKEAANFLLNFEAIGEISGRVVLAFLIDLSQASYLSNKNAIMVVYFSLACCLGFITQVSTYAGLASLTVFIFALTSLSQVLINGLIVDYLGELKVTLCYGMACFVSGLLLMFRPMAVHFFRDTLGSYDLLMVSMGVACVIGGLLWMVEPLISRSYCSRRDDEGNLRRT